MRLLNMPEISAAAAAATADLHRDTCLDFSNLYSSITINPLHELHK
jgi:hypothetical protein